MVFQQSGKRSFEIEITHLNSPNSHVLMNWYKNIWSPRALVVIFLNFQGEKARISALKTHRKEKKEIEDAQQFDTLEEVVKHYGKSAPFHLHVMGTGVLSRKIDSVPNYMEDLIISGNQYDFIFTSYDDKNTIAASFFRRQLIKTELEFLTEQKVHLLGITSGEIPLFTLLNDEEVKFEFVLGKKEDKITEFKRLDEPTNRSVWQGEFFTKTQLLAKALFSNNDAKDENFTSSEALSFVKAQENFRQYSQFKTYGISLVGIILLSLVLNYFYQNNLNNTVAQLELDLSLSEDNLALLERLEQEKIRKEQLVQSAGVNSPRFLSYYLDEIGRTVPKEINLHELKVFPLSNKLKNKHKVEVDQERISISGSTIGNEILDDWIEKMDRFEWIKSVELLGYLKNEEGRADFKLVIVIGK